jgi:hypothetical protein
MSIKRTAFLVAAVLSAALPIQSMAMAGGEALVITNHTDLDSTSKINGFSCSSSILGEAGITRAHSTNSVSNTKLRVACFANRENCVADVYMTSVCEKSGQNKIATVVFSVNSGIKSVVMENEATNPYVISPSGFSVTISHK